VVGVIVLDTNQLEYAQPPDGPLVAMLQTVAGPAGHELCLPEMALEEHLAHYRTKVDDAVREYAATSQELRRLVRYLTLPPIPTVNVSNAVKDRKQRLLEVFRILETPPSAWKEALLREARRQRPARASFAVPGSGARDAAIWLTALQACHDSGEDTYFVAADNDAFGKDELHTELAAEVAAVLGEGAARFRYCRGVEGLLERFAVKVGRHPGRAAIAAAEPVRRAVQEALEERFVQLIMSSGLLGTGGGSSRGGCSELALETQGRTVAYRADDTTWVCGQPTWRGRKDFTWTFNTSTSPQNVQVVFSVTTTLVMQLSDPGEIAAAVVTGMSQVFDVRADVLGKSSTSAALSGEGALTVG
jgi:hypothetical protein